MRGGRSERALAYVNRSARKVVYYNEFTLAWIRMLAKAFRQRVRNLGR